MARPSADIDADLARWTATISHIGKAMEGLSQDPGYLRLKAQLRLGALSGVTRSRGSAAVDAAEQLWMLYLKLDQQLSEAIELRRSNNPFGRDERLARIDTILTGRAIALPAEANLATMTLSAASDRMASFAEVFAVMQNAFATVRDIVLAAHRVWSQSGLLDGYRARIAALETEATELGCARPLSISDAAGLLARFETAIDADPIGLDDAGKAIAALLGKADAMLASARADQAAAQTLLAKAEVQLAEISLSYARTVKLRSERLAKIRDPAPSSAPPSDPAVELRPWLATLARTFAEKRPTAVLKGLQSWAIQAAKSAGELAAIEEEDKRLLDVRQDLRGRFSALTAKAEARAAQGRLAPETASLFQQARALLFGTATPLPDAVALLRRCETL
jgi:hypothetical protein